ncbi:MAG TPA: pentapeptide repeat-containing protein [Terriglobia bacterium]|nr:pentapeptide repeat-containing protein [Terriglobia bacterium]
MAHGPASKRPSDRQTQGRENYERGYAFEDRVADTYRLLGYAVSGGRFFSGRQVDLFLQQNLGDLQINRAVECKVGEVTADDLDKFALKLKLVRREFPDASGTIVGGLSFTDTVRTHASAEGIHIISYRELSAQILDGHLYAQALVREIEQNQRYEPRLYVSPVVAYESSGEGKQASEVIAQWLADGRWSQLTLLGDVGTGKSFLCRMVALQLAKAHLERPCECPLPLLVDLRQADREFSLEGLILTHFARHGLSRTAFDIFDFLLSEGRIVLILDGFDEMASKVSPTVTARNFQELGRCVKRNAKVLLTCRTHYFKSRTEEEEVVLGGSTAGSTDVARDLYWDLIARSGFRIAYLRPFSAHQIEEYIQRACGDRGSAVREKIRKIYNLGELSQRPLLLGMIVQSVDKLTAVEVNSAELYKIFTDAWIHRDLWRDVMRPEEKIRFLKALARSLWDQEKTTLEHGKLREYVGVKLAGLIDEPQKLTEIDGEIRTASFLVRDDRGFYGFAHSSYGEYFLARDLADRVKAPDLGGLAIRRLTNEVIDFLLCLVDGSSFEDLLCSVLQATYRPLVSENALVILYRLRRNLLVKEKGLAADSAELKVEMPAGVRLEGARLAQVNLEGAILHSAHLDGADLLQCIAGGIDLTGSSLRGASVGKGDLHAAQLTGVDAREAGLAEINLQGATVDGCDFTRADVSRSMFTVRSILGARFRETRAESAVITPGFEYAVVGRAEEGLAAFTHRQVEDILTRILAIARKYAFNHEAGAEAEDIASDVVLYVLSNPSEMSKFREAGNNLNEFVRTLVWRRMATLRHKGLTEVRRNDLIQYARKGSDGDLALTNDIRAGQNGNPLVEDVGGPGYIDEADAMWIPSDESFLENALDQSSGDNIDLMDALRKVLSEESLRVLIARYVYEHSVEQIAEAEGVTVVQVVRQLNKARELARDTLLHP